MSRSRRKHPYTGWTTCESEKDDKRFARKRLRRRHNMLAALNEDVEAMPLLREISCVWWWPKDGRRSIDTETEPELMRK